VESANLALASIETTRTVSAGAAENDTLTARALGYMGFALMKRGEFSAALPILERSAKILREFVQGIQRECERNGETKPTLAEKRLRRESNSVAGALKLCYQVSGIVPPLPELRKYPRTEHLFDAGGTSTTADDLVMAVDSAMLRLLCDGETKVVIEEKIDGANLGISMCPITGEILVQNRSHYISTGEHAQFSQIVPWVETHRNALSKILTGGTSGTKKRALTLFGEWVVARHSIPYQKLPGYFVAFDLLDGDHFCSRTEFHCAMQGSGIPVVPIITVRTFGPYSKIQNSNNMAQMLSKFQEEVRPMLDTPSVFRSDGGTVEGVVLRIDENQAEGHGQLLHKCKIVRPDFIRGCEDGHWATRQIEKQQIDYGFAQSYLDQCYSLSKDDGVSDDTCDVVKGPSPQKHEPALSKKEKQEFEALMSRARRRVPRCIVLCGLPASGKSTFAARLAAGFAQSKTSLTVVNQDKLGRKECVALAGRASRHNRVIIDRCNLSKKERDEWVQIMHSPPKGEIALVHFSADCETCVSRAQARTDHETIPFGRGERIIQKLSKNVEAPTEEERRKVYGVVEFVHSFDESNDLLRRWGIDPESVR